MVMHGTLWILFPYLELSLYQENHVILYMTSEYLSVDNEMNTSVNIISFTQLWAS